jgi:hypothetical protein
MMMMMMRKRLGQGQRIFAGAQVFFLSIGRPFLRLPRLVDSFTDEHLHVGVIHMGCWHRWILPCRWS